MNWSEVRWLPFQDVLDERGRLTAVEGSAHIPFRIARVFYVHQVCTGQERGGHAHKDTDQVAVAVHGQMKVDLSDGVTTRTFHLNDPGRGLYIPRLLFTRLYDFRPDTVLLVFASTAYDRSRSIRSWEEYLAYRQLAASSAGDEVVCAVAGPEV
ncbi:MAG TPA: FdtA/QdtA family cupin domain-containing protein [Candidatus Sulfotelmatobacter sp.]|nr:FdtA/QdtA family cupin domain-containing protein [Candidatus Sulfotelmatobacter sp.]HWI56387.1 FdtA/QdtA family cupin domain-containing protein [Bacillota bacterium]